MKKTIIILLASLFIFNGLSYAQIINGVRPDTRCRVSSDKQKTDKNKGFCKKGDVDFEYIVSKFGMPDDYTPLEEARAYDLFLGGRFFSAYYKKDGKRDLIQFQNEKLVYYSLETNRFLVLDDIIPEGIKVGDPFTQITSVIPYSDLGKDPNGGRYSYLRRVKEELYANDPHYANIILIDSKSDYSTYIVENDGIILEISYDCMELGEDEED